MEHITMNGVAPMRWNEMRRRVAALQAYAAIAKPTTEDRENAANSLDLSANQFKRLMRSWRLHKDPASLNGAGKPERKRAHRSDGLDDAVLDIIDAAIQLHGASEVPAVISNTVWSECDRRSRDRPSNGTIWNSVREARRTTGSLKDVAHAIIVGRAWAELPVADFENDDILIRPELLVALEVPERRIVGWACDLNTVKPPLLTDLPELSRRSPPLIVTRLDAGLSEETPDNDNVVISGDANARFARMIGPAIANIPLAFRLPRSNPSRLLTSKLDSPLNPDDARLAIKYAVEVHNSYIGRNNDGS